jgi:hypothetical protein
MQPARSRVRRCDGHNVLARLGRQPRRKNGIDTLSVMSFFNVGLELNHAFQSPSPPS